MVTWLHVSDFHFRGGDPYDRDVVLRALVKSVKDYRERGRKPDLIFATGDVAYSGKPQEYDLATKFFDDLLEAAGLTKKYLFVVPGNHDVDRDRCVGLQRTLTSEEEAVKYFGQDRPLDHLAKVQGAFAEWYNEYFRDVLRLLPPQSTCGPVEEVEVGGFKIGVLPINSALFCRDDQDHEKLWVGRRCIAPAIEKLSEIKADLNVALMHHPLDWLNGIERSNIKAKLHANIDFLLRGHLHEHDIEAITSVHGHTLHLTAGAAYDTRRWPNRALYCTIEGEGVTVFPIRYEDKPKEIWTTDPSLFPHEDSHKIWFPIPRLAGTPEPPKPARVTGNDVSALPRFRSNIPSRLKRPFVGRDELLGEIQKELEDVRHERALVLHGQPGVGKSELAREFGRRAKDRYPGGTFFVDFSGGAPPIDLATIGKNILNLAFPADLGLPDQCQQALLALGSTPSLLIYDNVRKVDEVIPWLPPAGMPCHVIITTLIDWCEPGWPCLKVEPLTEDASLQLVEEISGPEIVAKYGKEVAAGGLPVQIYPATKTLVYEQLRGRLDSARLTLTGEAENSFQGAFERLGGPAKLLLHSGAFLNPQRIPREELFQHLQEPTGWTKDEFLRLVDACLDLHLLEGNEELRMHQLFASFLLNFPKDTDIAARLKQVRQVQALRLIEIAQELADHPARTEVAAALMLFPHKPDAWADAEDDISTTDGEWIGLALIRTGRFTDALPWYERAVKAKQKGDVHGRVDNDSLSTSLHQVGFCLSETGKYEEALLWYERAVEAKKRGDVHGRVDNQSRGTSLHCVGFCLSETGRYEEALTWYERAVEAKKKGDRHGRLDSQSLGSSLHQVGFCLSRTGRYEEALTWYERAVEAKKKGDRHGRVDNNSLGSSLHQVGICLSRTGSYEEALIWYERAVGASEKGDVYGRVDNNSLGESLGWVGGCLFQRGNYGEAFTWYERAVEAIEKGDVHGRVDNDSLGNSLGMAGACLFRRSNYGEALIWYERAVEATEKGDVHGRVDNESRGRSLGWVGVCLSQIGKYEEALAWYERAVEAKTKGDVHGRVDEKSVAISLRLGAEVLRILERDKDADAWEKKAEELDPVDDRPQNETPDKG